MDKSTLNSSGCTFQDVILYSKNQYTKQSSIIEKNIKFSKNTPINICLNMIVKNESKVIIRMLESVYKLIDCYCISDTGSSDNTIELIERFFEYKKIPGKIIKEECEFKDFEYNRNLALKHCNGMADYILLMDADMVLRIDYEKFDKQLLYISDVFMIYQGNEGYYYENCRLVRSGIKDMKYIGRTHEYLNCPNGSKYMRIDKSMLFIEDIGDGGCKKDKFIRDIKILESGDKNSRSLFYLANSYKNSNNYEKAIETYKERIKFGGWDQETWYCKYMLSQCFFNKGDDETGIGWLMEAFSYMPTRLESIYNIVAYYRNKKKYDIAKSFIVMAEPYIKLHKDNESLRLGYLFLESGTYTYKFDLEYVFISNSIGISNISKRIVNILNQSFDGPHIQLTLRYMKHYYVKLNPVETINLDSNIRHKINGKYYNFKSSSPCIIPNYKSGNESKYLLNVRLVNYQLINNYTTYDYDKYILTINMFYELDENFSILKSKLFGDINFKEKKYGGIEDVRLYKPRDNEYEGLWFIGSSLHPNNNIGISMGEYNTDKQILSFTELDNLNRCEKNWVFFDYLGETHILYSWYPLTLIKLGNPSEKIQQKQELPMIFKYIRNSTCGFTYNNEIWFIGHIVSFESPRWYYHIIIVMDKEMKLLRYSMPIKLSSVGSCIEYCLGIIVEDSKVIISYSEYDSNTKISIYDKEYIESLLEFRR